MKKFGITVLCSVVAIVSVVFSFYMTKLTEKNPTLTTETVYQMAKDAGYDGTLDDFINEFKGAVGNDGRGIESAVINSQGHLIITYTDLTTVDVGVVNADSITLTPDISGVSLNAALMSSVSVFVGISEETYATGSGIIYKLDKEAGGAYIITNYHVIASAHADVRSADISVYLYGKEYPVYEMKADYVGGSASYDIAVLKIENSDIIKNSNVSAARLGNSESLSVLDSVMAVGNPGGGGISVTKGQVNIESENRYIDTGASGGPVFMRVIRTDAAINKGNSGGGLYAADGSLVGVVTAKDKSSDVDNISYAVPINVASAVADNIIDYCDGRTTVRGKIVKLGISLEVKSANVIYDGQSGECIKREEVAIKTVAEDSIAKKMGLKAGDVLKSVSVDGRKIEITRIYQAPEATIEARVGSVIVYTVLRGGTEFSVTINVPSSLVEIP